MSPKMVGPNRLSIKNMDETNDNIIQCANFMIFYDILVESHIMGLIWIYVIHENVNELV